MRPFHGRPIIEYSIEAAIDSGVFEKVIVSSDSDRIGSHSARCGAVYHKRPKQLAQHDTPMIDALENVIETYHKDFTKMIGVCMIYTTAPFIKIENLTKAYQMLNMYQASCVYPVYKGPHVEGVMFMRDEQLYRRYPEYDNQNSDRWIDAYWPAGQFFFTTVASLYSERTFFMNGSWGIIVPRTEAVDIDTEEDWQYAEKLWGMK